eukprot:m.10882 g.10882  ORF g.10882 m.10882 type:complete len:115 (-) comp6737_c0_seq1:854-1198(-)
MVFTRTFVLNAFWAVVAIVALLSCVSAQYEPSGGSCPPADPQYSSLTDCCEFRGTVCTRCCDLGAARAVLELAVGISVGVFLLCICCPVLYCFCVGAACFAGRRNDRVVYHHVK